ncbi:hypothetical protein M422DRAFT_46318 [Sphaerobolus stellatus SS14]|uniref:Uncharacterized protein n=1 Tax=Sphaerobolus stellatus (strain SS14) TaxID=990650 RepID=A0A0C9W2W0_SPHS4|nr:hypothetical protein M422DRAFT_46318 [Sphaerobolus stellatus SS14]
MPADSTQFAFSNSELDPPFHSVKYRFFSVYLAPVIDAILGAKAVPYAMVLQLDRRVRDQDVAPLIEFDKKGDIGAHIGIGGPGDGHMDIGAGAGGLGGEPILYWCHGLAAAIVVGSIVAKAPESPLAQPALDQVNVAYALFERAAAQYPEPVGGPAKALVRVFP